MSEPHHVDRKRFSWRRAIGGILAICFLWVLVGVGSILVFCEERAAAIGDAFGTVNALFAGLAFGGVIWAIFLQRQELEWQREELTLTREQLTKTADAQTKSEEALRKQVNSLVLSAHLSALNSLRDYHSGLAKSAKDRHYLSTVLHKIEEIITDPFRYIEGGNESLKLNPQQGFRHWLRRIISELEHEATALRDPYAEEYPHGVNAARTYSSRLRDDFNYIINRLPNYKTQLNELYSQLNELLCENPPGYGDDEKWSKTLQKRISSLRQLFADLDEIVDQFLWS